MARISITTNPTNLQEIAKKHVSLTKSDVDGRQSFRIAKLELAEYRLDGDELITVVAGAGNTSRRFEIGTVKAWSKEAYELEGLDPSQVLRFRLLIRTAQSARLVASAENLRCAGDANIESLMPIVSLDLGQRLWGVEINEDGPILHCNSRVFPSGLSAESYVPFRALVLPAALAKVLERIAADPGSLTEEGSVWFEWGVWMSGLGIEWPPQEESERAGWVIESVGRFCEEFRSADDLQQFLTPGESA